MTRHPWRGPAAVSALGAVLLSAVAPASGHPRVFVGGVLGFPAPYAYPHYDPAYPGLAYPDPPALGWVPGHWEERYDPWKRPYQAWIPPHLE